MEQLMELQRRDLITQLESGGFVRHVLDTRTGKYPLDLNFTYSLRSLDSEC